MDAPAQTTKSQILITDVGSCFGSALAKNLLKRGYQIYGAGKTQPQEDVLQDHRFTFVDIDLAQPFPNHLPTFDLIIHLTSEDLNAGGDFSASKVSAVTSNLISKARSGTSKVIFVAKITTSSDFLDFAARDEEAKKNIKLFLMGDIYGPGIKLHNKYEKNTKDSYFENNELIYLITQATQTDKIILESEGLTMIYPTYIDDALHAFNKFMANDSGKNIRFIISTSPLTALSCAYEIKNSAHILLQKELSLFFAGEPQIEKPKPEPVVRIHDLGFSPRFNLKEGLENTLTFFKDKDMVKKLSFLDPLLARPEVVLPKTVEKHEVSPQLKKSLPKKLPKLPSFGFSFKSKLAVLFVFVLVIVVFTGKISLDLYSGVNSLKSAQIKLQSGDFDTALKKATSAKNSFGSANWEFNKLTYPVSLVIPKKIQSVSNSLESAQLTASAFANFISGAKTLAVDLEYIASDKPAKSTFNIEDPQALISKAYFESARALALVQSAQKNGIFKSKLNSLETNIKSLNELSLNTLELTNLTADLIGIDSKKTYLILLQNNSELRPGGGFIGNFGEIVLESGKLKSINVEDIYTIDGQLKEKINPPAPLVEKLGVKQLYLRDSNWSTDFEINAKTARDFYKKETGKTVDGVIAIDLDYMQKLLEKIGPIKLDDYNEEITAGNLFDKGEYYAEVGFFPGSTQKRDFFTSLTNKLIGKVVASFSTPTQGNDHLPWLALLTTTGEALAQKHMLISFDNPSLSTYVKVKNWSNLTPPFTYNPQDNKNATSDYLALSEANVGANKVNRYLNRDVNYEMTVDRDAGLVAKLAITYKNNSPADTWPGGTYVNYLRVFTPLGSGLESYDDGQNVASKDKLKNQATSDEAKVEVTTQGNLTAFATLVEVPVKEERTITFVYRIPKNIKLEQAPAYSLYVQKQPGTEKDPFKFTFNLPAYLKIDSASPCHTELDSGSSDCSAGVGGKQNVTAQTNLNTDRQFLIKVSKK
ncbi:MAG: DUF4012 domain-containing protein [Patescibacteria group bacterium]